MTVVAIIGAPLTFNWDALILFLVTTVVTICVGHSVGMHRSLIHRSFCSPKWLERILVYLGTPFGMLHAKNRTWLPLTAMLAQSTQGRLDGQHATLQCPLPLEVAIV